MTNLCKLLSLFVVVLLSSSAAASDGGVEALGSATITQGNTSAAHQRALADAFLQAIDQAVADLVEPREKTRKAGLIQRKILRQARRFVARFRVLSQGPQGNVYQVRIKATVSHKALFAELRKIGVSTRTPGGVAVATQPTGPPKILLLAHVQHNDEAVQTYGLNAAGGGPIVTTIAQDLLARGFEIVKATGHTVPLATPLNPDSRLPLTDTQAAALASGADAGVVVVIGVLMVDAGRIRGTTRQGVDASLELRVLDLAAASAVITPSKHVFRGSGYGQDNLAAAAMAAQAIASQAIRSLGPALSESFPQESVESAAVLVRVRGVSHWDMAYEIQKVLNRTPGISVVVARRFSLHQVTFVVRGQLSAPSVMRALSRAHFRDAPPLLRLGAGQTVVVDRPPSTTPTSSDSASGS